MTTTTATRVRVQQRFPRGVPVAIAILDPVRTGDAVLDAQLALAVILARNPHIRHRDYTYAAVDRDGHDLAAETDPAVITLLGLLKGTDCTPDTQHAALTAAGLLPS